MKILWQSTTQLITSPVHQLNVIDICTRSEGLLYRHLNVDSDSDYGYNNHTLLIKWPHRLLLCLCNELRWCWSVFRLYGTGAQLNEFLITYWSGGMGEDSEWIISPVGQILGQYGDERSIYTGAGFWTLIVLYCLSSCLASPPLLVPSALLSFLFISHLLTSLY